MALEKLTEFLDQNHIRYMIILHSPAYTSQEIAEVARIPGKVLAKSVLVKFDDELAMAVLPASYQIDFKRLKELTGKDVVLAEENEFKDKFPGCETGAIPPFGNLWNMQVWVSESITEDEEIVFEAGSHRELIRMNYKDFERLVRPQAMPFSCKTHPGKEDMSQGNACFF